MKKQRQTAHSSQPDKELGAEAAHYLKTLKKNKQVSRQPGPLSPGETHRETINEKGEHCLKRERFSSL